MLIDPLSDVTRHIRRSVLRCEGAGCTDEQLLTFYIEQQEEAAFAALVRRHGPMVWNVCRRVISNKHDAEDAFQATFLVLVRKAAGIAPREMVGNWLYGVAYRTALKARATAARRWARERQLQEIPETATVPHESAHDLRHLLDQELNRLPHLYRVPIVLCDLEGKTRNEAAAQLGCPAGTLAARHARARTMLAKRLARHGFSVSGVALAALFQGNAASAGIPAALTAATLAAASQFAIVQAGSGALISVKVAALTESLLKTTLTAKLKIAAVVLLAASIIGGGVAVAVHAPADDSAAGHNSNAEHTDSMRVPGTLGLLRTIQTGGGIRCVVFSHDGKSLLTGGEGRSARLWETATGNPLTGPLTHDEFVTAVAISPDDKILVTVSWDRTARLWDANTGKPRAAIMRHREGIDAVAFSPNSKYIATGSKDGTAQLWDVSTGARVGLPLRHNAMVTDVTFLPDGRTLITSGWDGAVRKWDVATGKELGLLFAERRGVTALSVGRDGRIVLTASRDRGAQLWEVIGRPITEPFEADSYLANAAFSPDGKTFLTGGFTKRDGLPVVPNSVQLWETASARPIGPPFAGQDNLAFHPNGKICATAGQNVVNLWDLRVRLEGARRAAADSLERLWSDLAAADATRAYQAILALGTMPDRSVPFLEKHLQSAPGASDKRMIQASAVASDTEQILVTPIDPEQLRLLRTVQVLEEIGTPRAREVLRELGRGAPELAATREARAALDRLEPRR
jgi:RNA polymerase sigma factor (sigma-70 family)